jgi:signal transduction histidine kinase
MEELENVDVLIVEDSATQAFVLSELLKMHKMQVRIAQDGVEGLKALKENKPQIVISDIEMPKMNGYELCKLMKKDPDLKDIPLILLTNLRDPLDAIRGIECGANSFLTKPCDSSVLLSTIKNAIENKSLPKPQNKYQMEFFFSGQKHLIQVDQFQITELLLSTYSNAIQKNLELESAYKRLNQLYDEVKKKNEVLNELNGQKNKFLGMAAHDLRNPLGAIDAFCDLLLTNPQKQLDEKSHKYIERIKSTSIYMLNLINELLNISVIESGTITLNIVEVDLPNLILETLEYLKEIAEKKQIRITFKYDQKHSKIFCDPNKVIQVITNLVTNSIKFSHPGSEIELELEPSKFDMTIVVKDYGNGISTETKKKMFQPFIKGSDAGTGGEKCTGLGLAIVQKIVNEHHGKIRVESEVDKGTTFFITLPNQPDALEERTEEVSPK